jgi:hypothetical protein
MAIPHNEVDQLSTSEVEVDVVPEGDAAAMADVVKVAAGEVVTSGLGAEVGDPPLAALRLRRTPAAQAVIRTLHAH